MADELCVVTFKLEAAKEAVITAELITRNAFTLDDKAYISDRKAELVFDGIETSGTLSLYRNDKLVARTDTQNHFYLIRSEQLGINLKALIPAAGTANFADIIQ